jgi:hypothetical protein
MADVLEADEMQLQGTENNTGYLQSDYMTALTWNGEYGITEGQEWNDPVITRTGNEYKIVIHSGRKGSSAVAKEFNQKSAGPDGNNAFDHTYAPEGGSGTPNSLNFWIGLTATWVVNGTTITDTIYLAQGHFMSQNNWWLGGNWVVGTGPNFTLIVDNKVVKNLSLSGSTSHIRMKE